VAHIDKGAHFICIVDRGVPFINKGTICVPVAGGAHHHLRAG